MAAEAAPYFLARPTPTSDSLLLPSELIKLPPNFSPSILFLDYVFSFIPYSASAQPPGPSVSHSAQTTKAPRLSLPTSGFLGLGDFIV